MADYTDRAVCRRDSYNGDILRGINMNSARRNKQKNLEKLLAMPLEKSINLAPAGKWWTLTIAGIDYCSGDLEDLTEAVGEIKTWKDAEELIHNMFLAEEPECLEGYVKALIGDTND